MVSIIASEKGSGKTKQLIELANKAIEGTQGYVVFIDDDDRQMYNLHRSIRFVATTDFPLSNYRELIGFIYGIISQNNDITEMFLDGLSNIIKNYDEEVLIKAIRKFDIISKDNNIDIIFTVNADPDTLPEEAKKLLLNK